MKHSRKPEDYFGKRLGYAKILACLGLALLGVRLWYLQCVQGSYYRDLSENNRIRTIRSQAPRGVIYDREGRVLVRNRSAFQIALMLEDTPDVTEAIDRIAGLTGSDRAMLAQSFESERRSRRFEPKVLLYDVSREELARVKVHTHELPGLFVSAVPTRAYPQKGMAAQVVGYTREISGDQLKVKRERGYSLGDIVGQAGLEKKFEDQLRGEAGYSRVEVDARGARRGELGIVDPKAGNNLHLTIDLDLQKAAESALDGRRGAVVAIDPRNGELLVLASSPVFDVNLFSGLMPPGEWDRIMQDRDKPLTNRAIASVYPPGSTIKLLWGLAGLAEKKIDASTRLNCPGYYQLGRRRYRCHKRSGHGLVNLQEAIMLSCNAYFYQLGQKLNIDLMHKYLELFGLGQYTGISLPGEESATLPSRKWKLERFGERWYPGDTLPVSIGQGYLTVTPIQMVGMLGAIANGGTLYRPMLVKKVINEETGEFYVFKPEVIRRILVEPKHFENIREYAGTVVNEPRGTGKRAKLEGVRVGGKTGTAQVSRLGTGEKNELLQDHAWFVSFAPVESPEIAMVVVVENAGGGGLNAAPVSRQVMEAYFEKKGMIFEPVEISEISGTEVIEEESDSGELLDTQRADSSVVSERE